LAEPAVAANTISAPLRELSFTLPRASSNDPEAAANRRKLSLTFTRGERDQSGFVVLQVASLGGISRGEILGARPKDRIGHLSRKDGDHMELTRKRCVPCEGGVTVLDAKQAEELRAQVPGWYVQSGNHGLHRHFKFASFADNMAFISRMAWLAEAEGHHPNFCVNYNHLDVTLTTRAIGGLSENDFILAAKLDQLV
jgi:4a-hydroxytetrahydrobiopterin dehydratase